MPTLRMLTSLGTEDAKRLNMPDAREGDLVQVKADVADELIKRHWATEDDAEPAPRAASASAHAGPVLAAKHGESHDPDALKKPPKAQ